MCVGHMMHMKHMKHMKFEKGFFERTADANAFQRMGYELLPPPANSFHRLRTVPLPRRGRSWGENRRSVECRRARDARPYNVAESCNCEIRLQRWVASLQRLDVFATVGCTAVHRRGAHCAPVSYIAAPVNLNGYNNNVSSGRAKGHRGDRKAPISNRRQGRRP